MVAKVKFRVDPTLEAIGLYRDPDDDNAPLSDPLNNLENVIFHPALRYCGIVNTITGTLNLPAATTIPESYEIVSVHEHTLAAHGASGKPMILGVIKNHPISGGDVAWCGTVPIQQFTTDQTDPYSSITRWLTLGVNGTNLVAREQRPRPRSTGSSLALSSVSFDYEIHIFDIDLDSALPSGSELKMSNATGVMEIETPNGVFSMSRRYVRTVDSGGLVLPGGKTINTRQSPLHVEGPTLWRCRHGAGGLDAGSYKTHSGNPNTYPPSSWTVASERVTF